MSNLTEELTTDCFNSLAQAFAKWGDYNGYFRILSKMKGFGLNPNQDTFDEVILSLLIGKFAGDGNIEGAWIFFEEMISHGFRPTPTIYKMLVTKIYIPV